MERFEFAPEHKDCEGKVKGQEGLMRLDLLVMEHQSWKGEGLMIALLLKEMYNETIVL